MTEDKRFDSGTTPFREIERYLGYHGVSATPEIRERILSLVSELSEEVTPRCVYKRFRLIPTDKADTLIIEDHEIKSRSLYRNLKGCDFVYLFAATLGTAPDRAVMKSSLTSLSDPILLQAVGAAMIEHYCDHMNLYIKALAKEDGYYLRPRFSPGYGDFDIEHQRFFEYSLNMQKEIGVTFTDALLMTPSKSVTAVIGCSVTDTNCVLSGCENCDNSDCAYRRSE